MEDRKDPINSEIIAKAFLNYVCGIDFNPYTVDGRLPIKYRIRRMQNQSREIGHKIVKFWEEAAEFELEKGARDFDPELLHDLAKHDDYGLFRAASKASETCSYSQIGDALINLYNTYKKKRGSRPANPKVLPQRIRQALETLVLKG